MNKEGGGGWVGLGLCGGVHWILTIIKIIYKINKLKKKFNKSKIVLLCSVRTKHAIKTNNKDGRH